jgi:hypothetical protein
MCKKPFPLIYIDLDLKYCILKEIAKNLIAGRTVQRKLG